MFGSQGQFFHGAEFDPSQFGFGNGMRYEFRSTGSGFSDFFEWIFGEGSPFGAFDNSIFGRTADRQPVRPRHEDERRRCGDCAGDFHSGGFSGAEADKPEGVNGEEDIAEDRPA